MKSRKYNNRKKGRSRRLQIIQLKDGSIKQIVHTPDAFTDHLRAKDIKQPEPVAPFIKDIDWERVREKREKRIQKSQRERSSFFGRIKNFFKSKNG